MKEYIFTSHPNDDNLGVDGQVIHFNAGGELFNLLRNGNEGEHYTPVIDSDHIWTEVGWTANFPIDNIPESNREYTHIRRSFISFDISEIPITATVINAKISLMIEVITTFAKEYFFVEWRGNINTITSSSWSEVNLGKVYNSEFISDYLDQYVIILNPLDAQDKIGGFFGIAVMIDDDYKNADPVIIEAVDYKLKIGCSENTTSGFKPTLTIITDEDPLVEEQLIMMI